MSFPSTAAPGSTLSTSPGRLSTPTALRWGLHLLVLALLLLTVVRALTSGAEAWPWVVVTAALVGALYVAAARSFARSRPARTRGAWVAALVVGWLVLLALSPDAVYLAFPWFFLVLLLLPRAAGVAVVFVLTAAAVTGFAWHQRTLTAAMVIGPVLGAAVAIGTVLGYQALHVELERRRRLIEELDRTRFELAAVERRAGVMEERERLAREIHDTVAQGLSSIQLLLRAASRSLDPAGVVDEARASNLVEQARLEAQENLGETRRLVRALAPGDLEQGSLSAALRRLCETTATRTGLPVHFHHVGPTGALPTPVEVALLRIAQSALGNTIQHAQASRADVTLTVMDSVVTLDVVDDGIGFDTAVTAVPPPADGLRGFGLRSMSSRVAELGGVLTVESQPGRGSALSVHFVLSPGPAGPAVHEATRAREAAG